MNLRQLTGDFLAEKRQLRGQGTADNYRVQLRPVLDFAEQPSVRGRWPLAAGIDRTFVVELRAFLNQAVITPNGRPGATRKIMSARQVFNVLECLRTMFSWACQADVRKLPAGWVNPLTPELIGSRPTKDPLREDKLPLEKRIALVNLMDAWQLCHLALSVVLPLRPQEAAGLCIGDVNFDKGWFEIGTRLEGDDFTKARTSFKLPFPAELQPLLRAAIGNRVEGPLLRNRRAFVGGRPRSLASREELVRLHSENLAGAPAGRVASEQDRKELFRRLLRKLGGVTEDQLAKECRGLLRAIGVGKGVTLYTLRGSVTTAMARAKLPHLEVRYLTGHAVTDILNTYVSLDPVAAMKTYFDSIAPLLEAIRRRAEVLGIVTEGQANSRLNQA